MKLLDDIKIHIFIDFMLLNLGLTSQWALSSSENGPNKESNLIWVLGILSEYGDAHWFKGRKKVDQLSEAPAQAIGMYTITFLHMNDVAREPW